MVPVREATGAVGVWFPPNPLCSLAATAESPGIYNGLMASHPRKGMPPKVRLAKQACRYIVWCLVATGKA